MSVLAVAVIAVNWGVHIHGVNSGQVVQGAPGHFINPVVTVLIGVLMLRKRLQPRCSSAAALGVVAVVVLTWPPPARRGSRWPSPSPSRSTRW